MSIRVAPQAYKTRAHIFILYVPPPQNIFKLFSSRFCVLPPLSSQNIFKLFSARFCVLPTKHFPDNFISILCPSPPVFVSEHPT